MRILALDWGTNRIGGAVSDEEGKFAFALDRFFSPETALDDITRFVSEKNVQEIIIGNPLSLSGVKSASAEKAAGFAEALSKKIHIPINMIDERFSSAGAQKILDDQGLNSRQQRQEADNMAAQQLLQSYLDSK